MYHLFLFNISQSWHRSESYVKFNWCTFKSSFPDSIGDDLIVEVYNSKGTLLGHVVAQVASIVEDPVRKNIPYTDWILLVYA